MKSTTINLDITYNYHWFSTDDVNYDIFRIHNDEGKWIADLGIECIDNGYITTLSFRSKLHGERQINIPIPSHLHEMMGDVDKVAFIIGMVKRQKGVYL